MKLKPFLFLEQNHYIKDRELPDELIDLFLDKEKKELLVYPSKIASSYLGVFEFRKNPNISQKEFENLFYLFSSFKTIENSIADMKMEIPEIIKIRTYDPLRYAMEMLRVSHFDDII